MRLTTQLASTLGAAARQCGTLALALAKPGCDLIRRRTLGVERLGNRSLAGTGELREVGHRARGCLASSRGGWRRLRTRPDRRCCYRASALQALKQDPAGLARLGLSELQWNYSQLAGQAPAFNRRRVRKAAAGIRIARGPSSLCTQNPLDFVGPGSDPWAARKRPGLGTLWRLANSRRSWLDVCFRRRFGTTATRI